jgi:asparagine synthase (glutamine-hydrolysing)
MAAVLAHRGPDDSGLWVEPDGQVAFGHRRLAVVDLSPHGHQPMTSADGRWVLSYNGEIYNFRDVRRRLAGKGVQFLGGSDTEVLLAAVEHWGIDEALEASEGMFAMALWDRHDRALHLVRDRFGEKPLYYGWTGPSLAFSSELKSLRCLADFTTELDRDAVAQYLRYSCVPSPSTVYRDVLKVQPGQVVTFDGHSRPGSQPQERLFWSARNAVEDARRRPLASSPEELVDQAELVLSRSVTDRMVADVPIGAFLSGGVDSSLIVALMQQHADQPVQTFTAGFADQAFDESTEAAAVAAHLGTDHTELRVSDRDAVGVISRIPDIWDEPFADISQIPVLLVSELARSKVTVSLSGDGGDELFAGYNRHAWLERLWRHSSVLPGGVRRVTGSILERVPPGFIDGVARITGSLPVRWQVRNPATKVAKVAKVLGAADPADAYHSLVSHWDSTDGLVLGSRERASLSSDASAWPALSGVTEQMLWLDLVGYLPDDILTKLDRASMATSLESRVPFLDRSVLEFAWRLPMEMKLRGGVTKWILRQVLYRHVPPTLVDRPKMGFGVPIASWLRGPLRPWADDLLDAGRLKRQGLLDAGPVQRAWSQHRSGRRDRAYELWDVLVLQAWLDRWMPDLTG